MATKIALGSIGGLAAAQLMHTITPYNSSTVSIVQFIKTVIIYLLLPAFQQINSLLMLTITGNLVNLTVSI